LNINYLNIGILLKMNKVFYALFLIIIVVIVICICKKNKSESFAGTINIPGDSYIFGKGEVLWKIPKLDLGIDFSALKAANPAKILKDLFGEKVKNVSGYPYTNDCPDWNNNNYNTGNTVKSVTTYNNPLNLNENNCFKKDKTSVAEIKDVHNLWGSRVTTAIYTACGTAYCNSGWKYMGGESTGITGTCNNGKDRKVMVQYDCHG